MVDLTGASAAVADEDAVSQAAAAAVAAVAQAVLAEQQEQDQLYDAAATAATSSLLPTPLPPGWVMKASQSQPDCFYYYNYENGLSTWQTPLLSDEVPQEDEGGQHGDDERMSPPNTDSFESMAAAAPADENMDSSLNKRLASETVSSSEPSAAAAPPPAKRPKSTPKQVRVLHILRKHKDSRKPSSWRVPNITQTLEEARSELSELCSLLIEVKDQPEELRATFEELARTESDCSSAKRGGDLGFFGPKKMQPAFEKASFALEVGEMSELIETSSGVHVILRIG